MSVRGVGSTSREEGKAEWRDRRLSAFHPTVRAKVRDLAARVPEAADLAETFPGLLFALASDYGSARQRQSAIGRLVRGAPLKEAAAALGVPWWLRRLPAEAFVEPLAELPADPAFAARISDLLPDTTTDPSRWLWAVLYGHQAVSSSFALWVAAFSARQPRLLRRPGLPDLLRHTAAWAWHSSAPGTPGHALLRRAWTPDIGLKRAVDEVSRWRRRLTLQLSLGDGLDDTWLPDATISGYQFVALRTAMDFVAEAEVMDNCLDLYGDRMSEGGTRVFSIPREGRSVAAVEIGVDATVSQMPLLVQLRGPKNRRAPPEIWQATYTWLGAEPLRPLATPPLLGDGPRLRRTAEALWRPYLDWMGDTPARRELLTLIARETGVDLSTRLRARRTAAAPRRRAAGVTKASPLHV